MIKSREIQQISNREKVRPQQIQKDYVISWILWGISNNDLLKNVLIFKGGTCLKKVHIEDYRYSEDMDFTLSPDDVSDDDIYIAFENVFEDIKDAINMELSILDDEIGTHEGTGSIHFYIRYVGPLGGQKDSIKVDITRGEVLIFDVEEKGVLHEYTDLEEEEDENGRFKIKCYDLKEVIIEKMAALMGRTTPRDLYDFDYITNTESIDLEDVIFEFERKAEHKGHIYTEFSEKVKSKETTLKKAWNNSLQHQIKDLPKFKDIWRGVKKQLRKFDKIIEKGS
ncbi:nucleotidyl transferase AbiEii/AbiGii toxin family protein [Aureispira sp. CCB-QB1]|uniref:nucleotidyl transferase AbiEii/AbiGii toxin family protein n=1 Tax=Aureispira sp. CCB-QB1 TaxID=1313421 RepID=UPI00069629F4|nr:nucleotidyl transferase AbiEii/AbiGii toxin family protein [Aureispira sp. CCB-QB1]